MNWSHSMGSSASWRSLCSWPCGSPFLRLSLSLPSPGSSSPPCGLPASSSAFSNVPAPSTLVLPGFPPMWSHPHLWPISVHRAPDRCISFLLQIHLYLDVRNHLNFNQQDSKRPHSLPCSSPILGFPISTKAITYRLTSQARKVDVTLLNLPTATIIMFSLYSRHLLWSESFCPPQIHVENLMPNVMVLGGGHLGIWLCHEGRALMNGISTLIKRPQNSSFAHFVLLKTQWEDGCLWGNGSLPDPESAAALILDSELWETNFCS